MLQTMYMRWNECCVKLLQMKGHVNSMVVRKQALFGAANGDIRPDSYRQVQCDLE